MPFAKADIAASQTDSVVVAAVAKHRIRVRAYTILVGGTATNVTFNSKPSGAGSAISMVHQCGANGGVVIPDSGDNQGWFQTGEGEGLTVTTGAGAQAGVHVVYDLVKGLSTT